MQEKRKYLFMIMNMDTVSDTKITMSISKNDLVSIKTLKEIVDKLYYDYRDLEAENSYVNKKDKKK